MKNPNREKILSIINVIFSLAVYLSLIVLFFV